MRRFLLFVWRWLPGPFQQLASYLIRPRYSVAVTAVILDPQGRLLLCDHTYRRRYPWGLPGGDIKPGEDPETAVRREVREETGLQVDQVELLFVENSSLIRYIGIVYLCKGISGAFVPNDEVSGTRYFELDALPEFFPAQRETIARILQILESRSHHD